MPERDGLILGIDLRTTFSLVSVLPPASREARPLVLENALGERLTPSVVALADDGGLLVGAPALAMATTHPDRVVRSFKREMGTPGPPPPPRPWRPSSAGWPPPAGSSPGSVAMT